MRSKLWMTVLIVLPASTAMAQFGAKPPRVDPARPPDAEQGNAGDEAVEDPDAPGANGAGPAAMFAVIDVDGDGVISKVELRKWLAALKKLDADRDGNITLAEASSGEIFNQAGAVAGAPVQPAPGAGAAPDQAFDAAKFILFNDGDGNQRLSPRELPRQVQGAIRPEDDPDNNGLDMAELQAVMERAGGRARAWAAAGQPGGQRPFQDPNRRKPPPRRGQN
jgi:hypothetical protein